DQPVRHRALVDRDDPGPAWHRRLGVARAAAAGTRRGDHHSRQGGEADQKVGADRRADREAGATPGTRRGVTQPGGWGVRPVPRHDVLLEPGRIWCAGVDRSASTLASHPDTRESAGGTALRGGPDGCRCGVPRWCPWLAGWWWTSRRRA